MRPNWPAIITILLALVIVGWLLGRLTDAPNGLTIDCPSEGQIMVVETGDGVVAYCEE